MKGLGTPEAVGPTVEGPKPERNQNRNDKPTQCTGTGPCRRGTDKDTAMKPLSEAAGKKQGQEKPDTTDPVVEGPNERNKRTKRLATHTMHCDRITPRRTRTKRKKGGRDGGRKNKQRPHELIRGKERSAYDYVIP